MRVEIIKNKKEEIKVGDYLLFVDSIASGKFEEDLRRIVAYNGKIIIVSVKDGDGKNSYESLEDLELDIYNIYEKVNDSFIIKVN